MHKDETNIFSSGFVYHNRKFSRVFNFDTYMFRLQTEGHCFAFIQGEKVLVEQGDLLLFAPGDSYELVVDESGRTNQEKNILSSSDYYVHCNGSWVDQWWSKHKRKNKINIVIDESILGIWRQINLEKQKREENKEIADYLLKLLCLNIDRMIFDSTKSHPRDRSFLVYRIKHYIDEHATEPFNLQDVANYVSLSVSRTMALFKSAFGKSIMKYTMEIRLSLAIERMQYSKLTLEEIAETSGFGSYSYFFRSFRSRYGTSPNVFREKMWGCQ